MKNWVSIMIPCFNGAPFLHTLMKCLINQTYKKLHIIIVNDGSTDQSENIINEYRTEIEGSGKKLTYLKQENKGLAGAINTALSQVDTEFLTWMDVDDRISDNHIEKLVKVLVGDLNCQWVSCKGYMYNEDNLCEKIGRLGIRNCNEKNYAEDLLFHKVNCTPGLYMLRTSAFRTANNGMSIYCANRVQGQNMQMLVPMAFMYGKPHYLDEFLFYYTVRKMSLSHIDNGNIVNMMKYIEHVQKIKSEVIKMNKHISIEYKNKLYLKMRCFEEKWRLSTLSNFNTKESCVFVKEIFNKYFQNNVINNRCIRIWGYYSDGIWLHDVLKELYPQFKFGYVESDKKKCCEDVIYKDELDVKNDYIVSLLKYHVDIDELLCEKLFKIAEDYIYYEKELNESGD